MQFKITQNTFGKMRLKNINVHSVIPTVTHSCKPIFENIQVLNNEIKKETQNPFEQMRLKTCVQSLIKIRPKLNGFGPPMSPIPIPWSPYPSHAEFVTGFRALFE